MQVNEVFARMEGRGPVPVVNEADVKSVWTLYQDTQSQHPGKNFGVDVSIIEKFCSPGADVPAVTYRVGMIGLMEMGPGDLLFPWKQSGGVQDAVFRVIARMPMKWMGVGHPQSELPFDVEAFIQEVQKSLPHFLPIPPLP
jgi:hypothetical protein